MLRRAAHVGETIAPTDKLRLEDTAAYLVRNPLSLRKLVYLDGERAVIYRSRMNPSLGLEHLGLSSPQAAKPPPPLREVLRVAEHADGWGTPQQWDPA